MMCQPHSSPRLVILLGLLASSLVAMQSAKATQATPIRFEEIRVRGRLTLPSPDHATLIRSEGPTECVSFKVAVDRSIEDGQAYLEVRKEGAEGEPLYTDRVDFSSREFCLDYAFRSIGSYVVTAHVAGRVGTDTIRLAIETEPDVGAPSLKTLCDQSIGGETYRLEQVNGVFPLIAREFTAVVETRRPGRNIALIDQATGNVIGDRIIHTNQTLFIRANSDHLPPGRRTVFAIDTWSGIRSPEEIQVDVPGVDPLDRPTITELATARFAPMRPIADPCKSMNFHGWLQMRILKANAASLLIYRKEDGTFRRDRESEWAAATWGSSTSGGSKLVTLNLQDLPADECIRIFVQSQVGTSHRLLSPLPLKFQMMPGVSLNPAHSILLDSVRPIDPESNQPLPSSQTENGIETYQSNARKLELTFKTPDHDASQLVLLPEADPAMAVKDAISKAQAFTSLPAGAVLAERNHERQWVATLAPSQGDHHYRAVLYIGGKAEAISKPFQISINWTAPKLSTIGPDDFGVVPGVSTLILTIGGNPLVSDDVRSAQYRLYAATGRDTFEQFPLLPDSIEHVNQEAAQEIRLSFDPMKVTQGRYRLEIEPGPNGLRDRYGNTLIDGEGVRGQPIHRIIGKAGVTRAIPERGGMSRPTIIRILRPGEVDEQANSRSGTIDNRLLEAVSTQRVPPIPTAAWVFDRPARFSLTQFGPIGKDYEQEGAVIYEGMELVVAADGRYQVRFLVSTPAMPMTLRLVLFVQERGQAHPIQVTLPPIVLPPHRNSRGDYEAATWYVLHDGTLPMLARGFGQIEWPMTRRDGVARLGSYPTRPGSPAFYFGDSPGASAGLGF